jgi:plasmid stabilization system protein ParE|tara:strand:- start:201 stop:404 length:204 start_codon:yes stop_codon:yes gene_type:complete
VEIEERLGSFQKRDNLHEGLRHTIHERYLIFFIQRDGEMQIVRVLQGSQPLKASPWTIHTYLPPALV